MSDPPRRVRVQADAPARGAPAGPRRPTTRTVAVPARRAVRPGGTDAGTDADLVYDRALRRAQLRLALGTVAGFVVVVLALTVGIALIPELDAVAVGGVPLSWLLHAFAFYPVIVVFALLYNRAAARNERRYLALRGRE